MAKQTINLGTTPTGVGGDTPRSAFTKTQANFDEIYTALGGTTIPAALPVARGGTGGTTAAAARTALGLKTAATVDILGSVAAGAAMEVISNATGIAYKFANGLMITVQQVTGGYTANVQRIFNFPATFTGGVISVVGNIIPSGNWDYNFALYSQSTTQFVFMSQSTFAAGLNPINVIAVGRAY